MFWFNKENPNVVFADNRSLEATLCDGRSLVVCPDKIVDFRKMPWRDNAFKLVVFDPPHLINAGEKSWLRLKYGVLPADWATYINQGMRECMRVLSPHGVLVMKWSEAQIKTVDLLKNIDFVPLFGDKKGKRRWLIFMKMDGKE